MSGQQQEKRPLPDNSHEGDVQDIRHEGRNVISHEGDLPDIRHREVPWNLDVDTILMRPINPNSIRLIHCLKSDGSIDPTLYMQLVTTRRRRRRRRQLEEVFSEITHEEDSQAEPERKKKKKND